MATQIDKILGEAQKFLLFLVKEGRLDPNPLLFLLAASSAALYAFSAPPLPLSLAVLAAALAASGRSAPRLASALGAVATFTAAVYGIGFILTGRLPAEFLPTFLKAADSAALFMAVPASRGLVNALMGGACIHKAFEDLLAMVKAATLAPGVFREALAAYAVYKGRIDAEGAGFAVVYFLQHAERLYASVSLALRLMGKPPCRIAFDPLAVVYIFAMAAWIWQFV